MSGPPNDVHPVLRRASAPPAALDLLAQAQHGLDEAVSLQTANERYATAHLAALRTAAAVLAVRGRPEPATRRTARGGTARRTRKPGIRSAWDVLPEVAPELTEWSALFASGAQRRARAEAGIEGAASRREADDLVRDAGHFLRLVERMLVSQPALPQPRIAPADEGLVPAPPAPAGPPPAETSPETSSATPPTAAPAGPPAASPGAPAHPPVPPRATPPAASPVPHPGPPAAGSAMAPGVNSLPPAAPLAPASPYAPWRLRRMPPPVQQRRRHPRAG